MIHFWFDPESGEVAVVDDEVVGDGDYEHAIDILLDAFEDAKIDDDDDREADLADAYLVALATP